MVLRLDKNDPLDAMTLQELGGKPVLFDTWLDAMDALAGEPDCEEILAKKGLRRDTVLQEARAYREEFQHRLMTRNLPAEDRFELCGTLLRQAKAEPSPELARIYCEILCDPGFLLGEFPARTDGEDGKDSEDQVILQYLDFLPKADRATQILTLQGELAEKFAEIKKERHSPKPADCDTNRKYEIARCFAALVDPHPADNGEILLYNLDHYIRVAAASARLKAIEPLFLFRLLTRRQSYMLSTLELKVSLPPLWKGDQDQIMRDNGRNFKRYRTYLRLFSELCQIYQDDKLVDLPLCWYGLDQITALGDFYRQELQPVELGAERLPFPPTVAEMVEESMFSCFPNGYGDNLMLRDSGLAFDDLMEFQCSEHPLISGALTMISDYMNRHAAELTERFLHADLSGVKSLCQDILERSAISNRYQPKSAQNLGLLLSAINSGLMELEDYYAEQNLIQAGHELSKAPIRKTPELPV